MRTAVRTVAVAGPGGAPVASLTTRRAVTRTSPCGPVVGLVTAAPVMVVM
jgi:hypothetical protein